MNILFEEERHIYFLEEDPDKRFLSVSGLFDLVKPKFDSKAISEKYSKKGREAILQDLAGKWNLTKEEAEEKWGHLEFTPEDIREIWEEKKTKGLARGTKFHKEAEAKSLSNGSKRGTEIYGKYTKVIPLDNLTPGEYVELIIPHLRLGLIGTADKVIILPNKEFIIRDYKSDVSLDYQGVAYYNPKTNRKEVKKLLPPLAHLDDVNGVHYNIKESLYIYFLESYGYKFKEGWIDHVQFEDDEPVGIVKYPITYMKKDIINLLNWYKTYKSKQQ